MDPLMNFGTAGDHVHSIKGESGKTKESSELCRNFHNAEETLRYLDEVKGSGMAARLRSQRRAAFPSLSRISPGWKTDDVSAIPSKEATGERPRSTGPRPAQARQPSPWVSRHRGLPTVEPPKIKVNISRGYGGSAFFSVQIICPRVDTWCRIHKIG